MSGGRVLVLDDEENLRKILGAMLCAEGYEVDPSATIAEAKEVLRTREIQVVLSDLRLDGEDGLQLLKWAREEYPSVPVIILTAHGTVDSAVDAMKQGAFDYVSKPFERSELTRVIQKALLTYQYQSSQFLRPSVSGAACLMGVGSSQRMKRVYSLVEKVAPTESTVLITGESGTGKELIAQFIHEAGTRRHAPFIKINCAAIPETLMESELFGYERGAFTGAATAKPGRFELADGGTLFLDEIGEMSTEMQVKLLRVLQDGAFERLGGLKTLRVSTRLITATNRDLEKEVKEGRFREDLFYRLNVVPISLPPLRERREDIPLLVAYFVNKLAERMKRSVPNVSPEALELLTQFPWPGNIRQLEHVIERLLVMIEWPEILGDHLPEEILDFEEERSLGELFGGSLKDQVKEATRRIEKRAIEEALTETQNNVTRAAKLLNISRKGLQLKMKELGIR